MSQSGTRTRPGTAERAHPIAFGRPPRRASALVVVLILISVLSVFTLTAVGYLLTVVTAARDSGAEGHAVYLAELARADAAAYIASHPVGPWPCSRSLTAALDDRDATAGEYTYTITDRTLPKTKPRRLVQVYAYWPTQANPLAQTRLQIWMERDGSVWSVTAWATGEYTIEG